MTAILQVTVSSSTSKEEVPHAKALAAQSSPSKGPMAAYAGEPRVHASFTAARSSQHRLPKTYLFNLQRMQTLAGRHAHTAG